MNKIILIFVLFAISCSNEKVETFKKKDLTPTPPMGWNSWDCFGTTVTESEVKENAEYMANYMKDSGWEYIVVDIQWSDPNAKSHGYRKFAELAMDEFGRLIPAVNRFPSSVNGKGFKPLAEYIHELDLKLGIHIMRGIPRKAVEQNLPIKSTDLRAKDVADTNSVCPWNTDMFAVKNTPGGQAYYNSILELYNSWGIDYIKADDMTAVNGKSADQSRRENIKMLSNAIKNQDRSIVLSLSPGPAGVDQAEFLKQNAQLWRISDDFWDKWSDILQMFQYMRTWQKHIGLNTWPDADMLPLGKIGIRAERGNNRFTRLTKNEQITLMSLWSMFKSPLMFGGNLPDNDEWTLELITNDEVLAVNQNSQNNQEVFNEEGIVVWKANPKKSADIYLGLFNINEVDTTFSINMEAMQIKSENYLVRDLWQRKDLGIFENGIEIKIKKHGARLFKLSSKH